MCQINVKYDIINTKLLDFLVMGENSGKMQNLLPEFKKLAIFSKE